MVDITRFWKDREYRESLSADKLANLPQNPAGMIELSDQDLGDVAGGHTITNPPNCDPTTWSAFCSSWGCEPTERGVTC